MAWRMAAKPRGDGPSGFSFEASLMMPSERQPEFARDFFDRAAGLIDGQIRQGWIELEVQVLEFEFPSTNIRHSTVSRELGAGVGRWEEDAVRGSPGARLCEPQQA